MGRVIVSVILLVLLTILIVLNLGPTTAINLFGARFGAVPIVAVAMVSFALGVVYSLFLYVGQYFHRSSRQKLAQRHRDVEERERKLAAAQTDADAAPARGQEPPDGAAREDPGGPPEKRGGSGLSRFFKFLR